MTGAHSAKRPPGPEPHWNRAWAAFVFGAIAVIALALIAFVVADRRAPAPNAGPPMLLTELPTTAKVAPSSAGTSNASSAAKRSSAASTAPPAAPSTSAPRAPRTPSTSASVVSHPTRPAHPRPAGPCRSTAPCVVGGSANVAAALTAYRRAHGAGSVSALVTGAAQQCALTGGDGASCADPFAVAREPQPNSAAAIRDIGSGPGNFLLDPAMRSVEVGWAYDPRSRQYVCVLIERT